MRNKKITRLLISVFSGIADGIISFALSREILSYYPYDGHDIINVSFMYYNFGSFDYLSRENIFVYIPSLLFFLIGLCVMVTVNYSATQMPVPFTASRIGRLDKLMDCYSRGIGTVAAAYCAAYAVTMFSLVGIGYLKVIYIICIIQKCVVLMILKDIYYLICRQKDLVFAFGWCVGITLVILMLDSTFRYISIVSVAPGPVYAVIVVVLEIIADFAVKYVSRRSLSRNEVL